MIDYDNRIFKPLGNSENGETSAEATFLYRQTGDILTSEYFGGNIHYGIFWV